MNLIAHSNLTFAFLQSLIYNILCHAVYLADKKVAHSVLSVHNICPKHRSNAELEGSICIEVVRKEPFVRPLYPQTNAPVLFFRLQVSFFKTYQEYLEL